MKKAKIIAHRGANRYAPQNTMPAFERAVEIGVDGTETDVRATKDGQLVLCHDYTIDGTSDGSGKISDYTYEELLRYDFGSKFSRAFSGTRIPTVEEYLACMKKDDGLSVINIEIKSCKTEKSDVVRQTIDAAKRHGVFDRLLISSFDYKILIEAKKIDPACKTGYLYPTYQQLASKWLVQPIRLAKKIHCDALHPHRNYAGGRQVRRAHKAGLLVNAWTVNEPKHVEKMLKNGVDGIITDCPDDVKAVAQRYYKKNRS